MNKTLKIVLLTLLVVGFIIFFSVSIFLWKMQISPIFIEREWRERFDKNYFIKNMIFTIPNDTSINSFNLSQESYASGKVLGTYFDRKWDYLFFNDPQKNYVDYNTLSGGRVLFNVPQTNKYQIGISVCREGIFGCKTIYYNQPKCLELIYVPSFYERKRETLVEGCEMVNISDGYRDTLYFSVKY